MSLRQPVAVFICMIMAMALLWSRALLSFAPGVLLAVASIEIRLYPLKIKWLLTPQAIRNSVRTKPHYWVFTLLFFLYLVSISYSGNIKAWWSLTHPKLVFLLIPMAFALLNPLTKRDYMAIMLSLILMSIWSSVWVQVAYYEDYYLFNQSLGFGGSLPVPTNHIRYSVIIATSMLICLVFAIEDHQYKFAWERWVYGIAAAYLLYFLHVLSVRTGLVVAYAGILLVTLFYFRHLNRWKQFAMIALLIAMPIAAYKTLPGFEQKVNYTLYDLGKFSEGEGEHYSDTERWQSWRAGLDIGNQHPFFGTGPGHYKDALSDYYKNNYNRDTYEKPHNQFIAVFACFGLFGLTVFVIMLVYPATAPTFWKEPLLPALFLTQVLTMMVEHPLDTEVGSVLFLLMILAGMSYHESLFSHDVPENVLSTTPNHIV